jgi:maltose O-acetyltransferase
VSTANVDDRWWHVRVNVIAASFLVGVDRRRALLRRAGIELADDTTVQPGCFFFGAQASIGARTWINHRCYFDTRAPVHIGRFCSVGMEAMFCTSGHEIGPHERRGGPYRSAAIRVGDGTWIGTRALLLPGVDIGPGCVIAAGAVVSESCAADGLYAGVPARRIRDL